MQNEIDSLVVMREAAAKVSTRSRIILIFIGGGLCVALELLALRPRGPVYAGKALSEWLEEFNEPTRVLEGERTGSEPIRAIRAMGATAVPRLMEMMRARDSKLKVLVTDLLNKHAFIKVDFEPAAFHRTRVAWALYVLGPAAEPAVPELTILFHDDQTRNEAAIALVGIGGNALQPLLDSLSNTNAKVRLTVVDALSLIHPADAAKVVPPLVRCLKDENRDVRIYAHGALGNIAKEPDLALPALVESLQDPIMGSKALWAIGKFGTNAWPVIPALLKLLESSDTNVQRRVVETLRDIDPEAAAKHSQK